MAPAERRARRFRYPRENLKSWQRLSRPWFPDVLLWARETLGLPLTLAAQSLKVGTEALEAWEKGTTHPSLGEAERLAKLYGLGRNFRLRKPL